MGISVAAAATSRRRGPWIRSPVQALIHTPSGSHTWRRAGRDGSSMGRKNSWQAASPSPCRSSTFRSWVRPGSRVTWSSPRLRAAGIHWSTTIRPSSHRRPPSSMRMPSCAGRSGVTVPVQRAEKCSRGIPGAGGVSLQLSSTMGSRPVAPGGPSRFSLGNRSRTRPGWPPAVFSHPAGTGRRQGSPSVMGATRRPSPSRYWSLAAASGCPGYARSRRRSSGSPVSKLRRAAA